MSQHARCASPPVGTNKLPTEGFGPKVAPRGAGLRLGGGEGPEPGSDWMEWEFDPVLVGVYAGLVIPRRWDERQLMILWFDSVGASDVESVGGKGANLGECARVGLPVPPGFCVTTEAYRAAVGDGAVRLVQDAAKGDADAAREFVHGLPVPAVVSEKILAAYRELGEPAVAVRSSATAEDMADASFAGQQDTYLGVRGPEAVMDAVRRCWASLWTDRAVDYRRQQGVSDEGIALAVVVQQMVDPDVAGVLFTRDPVSGDDSTMLVSASYGLGESVVAALVTPDTFILGRRPASVTSREIGTKETRIDAAPAGGTVTSPVPEDQRTRPCLGDDDLLRVVALGERVEAHYGRGQDIEWAFDHGDLYLLQARPITTAVGNDVAGHDPARNRTERVLRDDLIEHFPAPFPLDLMAVRAVQDVVQESMRAIGMKAPSASELVRGDDDGVIRIHVTPPRPTAAIVPDLPRVMRRALSHDPSRWPEEEASARERLGGLRERADQVATADDPAVVALIEDSVAGAARMTGERFLHYLAPMMLRRAGAASLIKMARLGQELTPEDLYGGLDYKTAEINAGLLHLANEARRLGVAEALASAAPGLAREALAATPQSHQFESDLTGFLDAFGARTTRMYLPFSNSSWREDPEALLALLAASLRGQGLPDARETDAVGCVESKLPRPLARWWRKNAVQLRAMHVGREGTLYLIEEFFVVARAAMDELAARLVARGVLGQPDDVRYLYYEEARDALLSGSRRSLADVAGRRHRRRPTAEAVWWDRGDADGGDGSELRGRAASAGRALGKARIIRGPAEFGDLEAGDVLVCPFTDPTWTPLFALASAVVADSGGPLSHAAIVAREYGIPAVLGMQHATATIPNGARVLVDGTAGVVKIQPDAGA